MSVDWMRSDENRHAVRLLDLSIEIRGALTGPILLNKQRLGPVICQLSGDQQSDLH